METLDDVVKFFEERGYRHHQPANEYSVALMEMKYTGDGIPHCLTNDAYFVHVHVYEGRHGLPAGMEFDVGGEYRSATWVRFRVHLRWSELSSESADAVESDLRVAWVAICERTPRTP